MARPRCIGPPLPPGPVKQQRTRAALAACPRTLLRSPGARAGFTLVELLTVITIIAILATLLMTTLSSVKRKAREAVCTSNLRQIGIALHLYLEDFRERPPDLQTLASAKYLGDGKILRCPADRTPRLDARLDVSDVKTLTGPEASNATPSPYVSYQHPLGWTDDEWNKLMQLQTRAGVVVCTFHDVARARDPITAGPLAEGLILRGQLDGTVVRRHLYRPATDADGASPPDANRNAASPTTSFAPPADAIVIAVPPWDMFSDEPAP